MAKRGSEIESRRTYGWICFFFFFVKNMQKDALGWGKSGRCRENKRRGEKTVAFLLGHVCVQKMRAFYQHRMHRGEHMCFLSLDGFSSTLAVPRLCAYLFKPSFQVLPRSEKSCHFWVIWFYFISSRNKISRETNFP